MEKNWLIRTKSNHILGPISKTKLKELLGNDSLKSEDEICSGNGFWMFVREKELVEKYVYGEEVQPFNPVSEAENVLTSPPELDFSELKITISDEDSDLDFEITESLPTTSGASEISLPESSDLDYPSLEDASTLPPDMDLEFDSVENLEAPSEVTNQEIPQKKKVIKKAAHEEASASQVKKSWLNDKALFTIAVGLLIVAIIAFYYRKRLIEKFLNSNVTIELINSAHAQPAMLTSTQKKSHDFQ